MIYASDYGCFGAINAQSPECRAARDGTRGVGPPLRDGCAARLRGRPGVSPKSRGVPFPWSPRLNFGKAFPWRDPHSPAESYAKRAPA